MAIIVRHRCQRCGGSSAGAPGEGAWVRCPSCRAILAFDWLGFFESPDYAAYLTRAASSAQSDWARYSGAVARAEGALSRGDAALALATFREAVSVLIELTPFMYPPEVHRSAAYREATLTWQAWWLLQCRDDDATRRRQQEIEGLLRAVDYRDPLPTLRQVTARMRVQFERLGASDAPPDPDGMTPSQRARVSVGLVLGAWVRMLSLEQRLELLRELHGAANVLVAGAPGTDELGLFIEVACTSCGLHGLQARASLPWACLGCFRRWAPPDHERREAVQVACPNCHASVALGSDDTEVRCGFCGGAVLRLVETGRVAREFAQQIMHETAERNGLPASPLEAAGLAVTSANHLDLVCAGLVRIAEAYGTLIPATRYAKLIRSTAAQLKHPVRDLASQVLSRARREGSAASQKLVELAVDLLARE